MRKFSVVLLFVFLAASFASAELLTTANPIGQGKWAVLGSGLQDSNVGNTSGITLTSLGGYVGYGVTDQLDLFANLGYSTMGGLAAGVESSLTAYGATLKYRLLTEGENIPVSVAAGVGCKALSNKAKNPLGEATTNGSQVGVAAGVSKVIAPFIPYGGIAYRSTGGAIGESTQIDITAGSAIAWSTQGAVFVEYTLQSITPKGGTAYSSGQIGIGVGYTI